MTTMLEKWTFEKEGLIRERIFYDANFKRINVHRVGRLTFIMSQKRANIAGRFRKTDGNCPFSNEKKIDFLMSSYGRSSNLEKNKNAY